jgi:uncharacterized alpha-E superfamily protein
MAVPEKQAHEVMPRVENATTKEIFKTGLHEFITAFVEDNDRLGQTINGQYFCTKDYCRPAVIWKMAA